MTNHITSFVVRGLWEVLERRFNLRLLDKDNAVEMSVIASALDTMGIMDQNTFLEEYATTVGRSVYLPFELGNPDQRPLISQAMTITHEAQHAHQYASRGRTRWAAKYLADPTFRAAEEADASASGAEVYYELTGRFEDPQARAERLRAYAIGDDDIATVAKRLSIIQKTIRCGGVSTEAGRVAVRYLRAR